MTPNNRKLTSSIATIFTISVLILLTIPYTKSQEETDNEKEFSYDPKSKRGPDHWGEIHEDWAMCGKGHMQSPISISDKRVQLMSESWGDLRHSDNSSDAVLHNRGHDTMLKWEGEAGALWINGTAYNLLQLHWHWPSEHSINGRRYTAEMHVVHESADKKIAVLGFFYKIGRRDPLISMLGPKIKKLAKRHEAKEKVGTVEVTKVVSRSNEFYRYMGSLTTPPCTEGVIWTIDREVHTLSRGQLKLLKEAVHDGAGTNARPLQKVNKRVVGLYCSRKWWHFGY